MKKNLLIWDFDGVIADTEKLWLKNRQFLLNKEFGLNWNFDQVNLLLRGTSDKTKKEILAHSGIQTDNQFWENCLKLDYQTMKNEGITLTPHIKDIFKLSHIKQCIATGGNFDKTLYKIKTAGIEKYFPTDHIFTADMVQKGKPEPDIFLLAAQKMEENPENCVVVEDSTAGLTAAIKAGCLPIAFVGGDLAQDITHLNKIKDLGIYHIYDNMLDLKAFMETIF